MGSKAGSSAGSSFSPRRKKSATREISRTAMAAPPTNITIRWKSYPSFFRARTVATSISQTIETGMRTFHPSFMNWS